MIVIATDLDRTLLPNGNQEYDDSMYIFSDIIKKEAIKLIFVTGRNLKLVKNAIREFETPIPDFIIAEVGTRIFYREDDIFIEDAMWFEGLQTNTKNWDIGKFREVISKYKELRVQEEDKQNAFKLSYYIDEPSKSEEIVGELTAKLKSICADAVGIYSVDGTRNLGFFDVLSSHATKVTALEYLREELNVRKDNVVFCGDSGNDILPLTSGYKSILVRNAIDEVKSTTQQISIKKNITDKLYIASGYKKLNGYYVSGIIEGLIKFKIVSEVYIE